MKHPLKLSTALNPKQKREHGIFLWTGGSKHKRKLVWNPQIIVVLPAINSVQKMVWNQEIFVVFPAMMSLQKMVWNPQKNHCSSHQPQFAENGLESTNNSWSPHHKQRRKMVANPQIIAVINDA